MKNTRQWPKKKLLLFSVLTFVLFFVLAEIVCRVGFYFRNHSYHTTVYIQGSPLKTADSLLVYGNTPYYLDYDHNFQYSAAGMKSAPGDVDPIVPRSAKTFRVLLTGASAMEGMGSNKNGEWMDITGVTDYPWNKSIAWYLQRCLQDSMPGTKVEVFNAACSGYQAWQSFARWQSLQERVQPNWVISMDGANEPTKFMPGETYRSIQQDDWAASPQFHFPLRYIVALTRHSAFINALKRWLFSVRQSARLRQAAKNKFPARAHWLETGSGNLAFAPASETKAAVDSFYRILYRYDSALNRAGVAHLLLVQPHLCLRDSTVCNETERALLHYYSAFLNDRAKNTFMREVHSKAGEAGTIVRMNSFDTLKEQVFVDYCHFTESINKKIAVELCRYILSDKTQLPFSQ